MSLMKVRSHVYLNPSFVPQISFGSYKVIQQPKEKEVSLVLD